MYDKKRSRQKIVDKKKIDNEQVGKNGVDKKNWKI